MFQQYTKFITRTTAAEAPRQTQHRSGKRKQMGDGNADTRDALMTPPACTIPCDARLSSKVLVVVPDIMSNTWIRYWATSDYPTYRITGIDGSAFDQAWARISKQVSHWEQTGGVLLIDFGRLVHVLTMPVDTAPAVHTTQGCLISTDLLLVDAVQKAHWQLRGPKRNKVRVADVICRLRPQKTIFIADVASCALKGGNAAESTETCASKELVLQLAEQLCDPAVAENMPSTTGASNDGTAASNKPTWFERPETMLTDHLALHGVKQIVHNITCDLSEPQQNIANALGNGSFAEWPILCFNSTQDCWSVRKRTAKCGRGG